MYFYTLFRKYQFKPQVAHAQAGVALHRYLHLIKVIIFLIVAALVLLDFTKGGLSMKNFIQQFANVTTAYLISVVAGMRPAA